MFTQCWLAVLGLFNSILINRFLGPALKGEYAYILNIVNILVILLNLGIYQSYPFFKRQNIPMIRDKYIHLCLFQFLLLGLIGIGLSVCFWTGSLAMIFTMVPLMIINQQLSFIILIENINIRNVLNIINSIVYTFVLSMIFLFAPRNYMFIILLLYFQEILSITLIFLFSGLKVSFKIKDMDFSLLVHAIKFGLYPMLTALLITLNYKVDIIILKWFVDFEQIGYYTLGVGIAGMAWIIPDAFKNVLFSKTAKDDSIDDIVLSLKSTFYINLLMFIFIALVGRKLIVLLYGVEYMEAYGVTLVIFAGVIPMTFFKLITTLFRAKGKQKISFQILLVSVIANIIANFITIPYYGIIGAALSSVLSYGLCGGLFLGIFIKNYGLKLSDILIGYEDIITLLPLMVRERVQVRFYEKIRTKKKVYREAEGIVGVSIEELLTPDIINVFTRDKEIMDSINNISDKLVISPARCYIGHSYNAVEFIWIPIKEQENSVLISKGYDRQNAKKSSQFIAQLKEDKEQLLNLKEKVNKAHEAVEKLNTILSELKEEEAILEARIDEKIKVSGLVGMNYARYHREGITKLKKSLEINGRKMERACDMITIYSKNKEVMETEMEERTKDFLFNLLGLINQ